MSTVSTVEIEVEVEVAALVWRGFEPSGLTSWSAMAAAPAVARSTLSLEMEMGPTLPTSSITPGSPADDGEAMARQTNYCFLSCLKMPGPSPYY